MIAKWEEGANEEQLAVIRHHEGPLCVMAQAGSGKTFALVRRILALVALGVDPSRIFAVTFSTKGAQEMGERLVKLGLDSCEVRTWHAFCLRVIKEDNLPESRWAVDDKDREKILMKQILGWDPKTRQVFWKGADITRVRRYIGHCKANLIEWTDVEAQELAREMFGREWQLAVRAYGMREERAAEQGLLTFDDFLVVVARYFASDELGRSKWASRFDHVLTDEAQDNNRAQVELARALSKDHRNLMVVGDVAQAIYGFRGSKPDYLAAFTGEWSATNVIMSRNYRSASRIIAVANEVIRPATIRVPSDMRPCREGAGHGKVSLVRAATFDDEAEEVAAWIRDHVEEGGAYGDSTVLFRLNAQSRALEDALLRDKIPYVIVGGVNFWQRKEVKDVLAYLRVASGRDDDRDGVKRCINAPFRFLGTAFVERLMAAADAEPESTWPQLVNQVAREAGIQRRQQDSAIEWARMMTSVGEMIRGEHPGARQVVDPETGVASPVPARPAEILNHIINATGYVRWLEQDEGEESIETSHAANVREMVRVAESFATARELLDYIDQNIRETAKAKRTKGDRVLLMSIHRSKGLEWPRVWVVGCNDKILPHAKGDVEEERRLMYVAVTRARDELVCSYAESFSTKAGVSQGTLSSFLARPEVRVIFEEETAAGGPEDNDAAYAESLADVDVAEVRAIPSSREAEGERLDRLERALSDENFTVKFSVSYREAEEDLG